MNPATSMYDHQIAGAGCVRAVHGVEIMRPLIVGNWKMHGLPAQLAEIEALVSSVRARPPSADIVLCVPSTLIARAAEVAAGRIGIGGQDCHSEVRGAFTGDISAEMLRSAGARAVILGHAERRRHHGETSTMVAAKAKAAWRAGLLAIICIGDAQGRNGQRGTCSPCMDQIRESVPEDAPAAATAVAYEPLQALSMRQMPTPVQIAEAHAHARECLVARLGAAGKRVRILYGGSVKAFNAREILASPGVDGALVSGASLKAAQFEAVYGSPWFRPDHR